MEAFEALLTEVEQQGGALLPDEHMPEDVKFRKDQGYIHNRTMKNMTCGCGQQAKMAIPYETESEALQSGGGLGAGIVPACAVCDSVGHWPRFCEEVYAADPGLEPDDTPYDQEEDDGFED